MVIVCYLTHVPLPFFFEKNVPKTICIPRWYPPRVIFCLLLLSQGMSNGEALTEVGVKAAGPAPYDDAAKHHCRSCGRGVCESCSKHRMPVPERGLDSEPVRVCDRLVSIPRLYRFLNDFHAFEIILSTVCERKLFSSGFITFLE